MTLGTYTHTWTQTRLETIQDQFRYLLTYGDHPSSGIDAIVDGVGEKAIQAVGLYGCDSSGLRVIEVELRVDWDLNAQLTLSIPTITSGLSGWEDKQAPEVKVAGRRFAEASRAMGLKSGCWIALVPSVIGDSAKHGVWKNKLGLGGGVPAWKNPPQERPAEPLMDLSEASVVIRRAGDR